MHIRAPFLLVAAAMVSFGCVGSHARVDAVADERIEDLRASYDAAVVTARCDDGRVVGPSCGFVVDTLAREEVRRRFVARHCKDVDEQACDGRFRKMTDTLLAERYYAADAEAVERACDREASCSTPRGYERALMQSHNDEVASETRSRELRVEAGRRRGHRRVDLARADLVEVLGSEMLDWAGRLPRCRAYPSVISGGDISICD